jgi:hypothetical protein
MAFGPYTLDLWKYPESEHICTLEKGIYLTELAIKLARQHSRQNGPNTVVTLSHSHTGDVISKWRYGRPLS